MARLGAFAQRARRAVALYGVAGTLARGVKAIRASRNRGAPSAFDTDFGVDTAGVVRLEGLHVRGDARWAVHYQPSDPNEVRTLLDDLPITADDFVFVDMGSGKGRVVLLASQLPFKRVIGVEFCEELDDAARANLAAFPTSSRRSGDVSLLCMDATQFRFPSEPLVLYFYNPFLEPTMRSVIENLTASLTAHPRPVFIVTTGDRSLSYLILEAGLKPLRDGVYSNC